MDSQKFTFDATARIETEIYRVSALKDIKIALRKLGIYNTPYKFMSGMGDTFTDDYVGLYFFDKEVENFPISPLPEPPYESVSGKTLAIFLHQQYSDPALTLYESIPNAKLGGWKLWGGNRGGLTYLAAERILIERMN